MEGIVDEVDEQDEQSRIVDTRKKEAIRILTEFNLWRRGEGQYSWSQDPAELRTLEITPRDIGKAIDYAVQYMKEH